MKILQVSALYPPYVIGGAEMSAYNLGVWLVRQGHEVAAIRATDRDESEGEEVNSGRVRVYRVRTPHLYPTIRFPEAPGWQKPLWHLQDHFDPRIRARTGRILDTFKPDLVVMHLLQGIGYPMLQETAERRIPVLYMLHDLGLACVRMSMFKNGENCVGQCTTCRVSARYKAALIERQAKVGFISPSRANLETLKRFFPVDRHPSTAIPNPNAYPKPQVARTESRTLRLLYAGRIHESKGVEPLLEAVARLARDHDVSLTIAGRGFQEEELRARFGDEPWCHFLGFLPQTALADVMANSDLLCIPSIWAENSPGVVIQALGTGLPVMGSDKGGIPELVHDGANGRLVRGDQTADAWYAALLEVAREPAVLAGWREAAMRDAGDYEQDRLGARFIDWIRANLVDERASA